jgi:hypothetical protein
LIEEQKKSETLEELSRGSGEGFGERTMMGKYWSGSKEALEAELRFEFGAGSCVQVGFGGDVAVEGWVDF